MIAAKLLAAIDASISRDNGNAYRRNIAAVLPQMHDWQRDDDEPEHRPYLGASAIGDECLRRIWYTFRWAYQIKDNDARMLRLWNRGHLEEARIVGALVTAGANVRVNDTDGRQFRFKACGGHYSGAGDGIVIDVPDAPGYSFALEMKTMANSYFVSLSTKGVALAEPKHYGQALINAAAKGLDGALYIAVNKNNDALHAELLERDDAMTQHAHDRAAHVIFDLQTPPPKMRSASLSFWKCKLCPASARCHSGEASPVNCRTCAYSEPSAHGRALWLCRLTGQPEALTEAEQRAACGVHRPMSGLE